MSPLTTAPLNTPGDVAPSRDVLSIGRYVTIRRLGQGGAGTVYAAFDPHLDRKVALKLLHEGGGAAALIREAKLLASLSHPNIVTVFDSGIFEGRAFLVMELVVGEHLGEVVANRTPTIAARLEMILCVARALEAAHEAGLVHGDVKPSNILVDEDGTARLGDFGIAREVDGAWDDERGTAMPAGTPAFMAPEQHRGHAASMLTDQYSLCLTAWQTLALAEPFPDARTPDGGPRGSITRSDHERLAVAKTAPRGRPRGSLPVPRAVVAALVRGLEPDPDDRFASTTELRQAIEAALRARGSRRRIAGLAALAVGGVAAAWIARAPEARCDGAADALVEHWHEGRRREVTAAFVNSGLADADVQAAVVGEQLDAYGAAWAAEHTRTCEATERGEASAQLLDRRMACLRRAGVQLSTTAAILADGDRQNLPRIAAAVDALPPPESCANVGDNEARIPGPEIADEVSALEDAAVRARTLRLAGDFRGGLEVVNEDTVARAAALAFPPIHAEVLLELGYLRFETGDPGASAAHSRAALEQALASGQWSLGRKAVSALLRTVGGEQGDPAAALMLEPVGRALLRRSPDVTDEAAFHNQLAVAYEAAGRYDDAIDALRHSLKILASIASDTDTWTALESRVLLGDVLEQAERFDEALAERKAAVEVAMTHLGAEHLYTTGVRFGLAQSLLSRGDTAKALEHLQAVIAVYDTNYGPHSARAESARITASDAYRRLGQDDRAETLLRFVLDAPDSQIDPVGRAVTRLRLVDLYLDRKETGAARAQATTAIATLTEELGPEHARTLRAQRYPVEILRAEGDLAGAREQLETLLPRLVEAYGREHTFVATSRALLGILLVELGEPVAATDVPAKDSPVSKEKHRPAIRAKL
ncbi:MAG: serine/threonine-protein kinase, partial [Myxococcota bacterium]